VGIASEIVAAAALIAAEDSIVREMLRELDPHGTSVRHQQPSSPRRRNFCATGDAQKLLLQLGSS
jgi:hypothetical protein